MTYIRWLNRLCEKLVRRQHHICKENLGLATLGLLCLWTCLKKEELLKLPTEQSRVESSNANLEFVIQAPVHRSTPRRNSPIALQIRRLKNHVRACKSDAQLAPLRCYLLDRDYARENLIDLF
jgi:hypothetical protein